MAKLRAKEKQLPWRVGGTMLSQAPGMGHMGVTATPGFPLLLGTGPALASLERNREIHQKHPVRWLGKPALGLGWGRDVASVTRSCGAVAEILPRGGRAGALPWLALWRNCPSSKCKRWKLC